MVIVGTLGLYLTIIRQWKSGSGSYIEKYTRESYKYLFVTYAWLLYKLKFL
jgi:hypothetical protein